MKLLDLIKGKYWVLFLFVLPALYVLTGIYFRFLLGDPSLRSVDPDYVYFMSGLNLAEGHLKVGHIDHPGTPLQYLAAVVFRITYLFRGGQMTFIQDILSNPDLYMKILNLVITLIMTLSVYVAGRHVYRKSGSILYGALVQTLPFITFIWYEIIGRITPELLMPLPVLALTAYFIGRFSDQKTDFNRKDLILLALIMAFGLSIKLTMLPLWIIPIIVVRPWLKKTYVMMLSFAFFLIISLPATLQIERFWGWISDLFVYSGQYGNGEKNVVNWSVLYTNLGQIARLDKFFTFLVLFQIVLLPLVWVTIRKSQPQLKVKIWLAFAIFFAILAQALMAGKQFAPRYFIPANMLSPLLLYLSLEFIRSFHKSFILKTTLSILLSVFLIWHFNRQIDTISYTSEAIGGQLKAREATFYVTQTFEPESIRIITSQDYGSPFQEYALLFSTAWSANSLKSHYAEELAKLYPNTYQFTTWDGRFRFWGEPFNVEKIIELQSPVYLYLERNDDSLYERTEEKLKENGPAFEVQKKLIYHNIVNNEAIYQLIFSKPIVSQD